MANTISSLLECRTNLRKYLFPRGFLLTNDTEINASEYPFYDLWNEINVSDYKFFIHKEQRLTKVIYENITFILIGHAYEPVVTCEYQEQALLEKCAHCYIRGEKEFTDFFNLWTGSFALFIFDEDKLIIYGDPSGMQMVFYGYNKGKFYAASHTNLIGDICSLDMSDYIKKLINYRYYHLFGKALPGDLSPYDNFKRVIPNHNVYICNGEISINRFFPTDKNNLSSLSYDEIIENAGNILKNSMGIIYKKWNRPAISLTGGCDSKTTLSCTVDNYDNYSYFSYTSQDSETVDAIAAKNICQILNIPHKTYRISSSNKNYTDLEEFKQILAYNSGSIGKTNANDVRKRVFFAGIDDFDVEVKSWVSEVARAYYHKRFAKKHFPKKLTPKYATSLYKVFITNRDLVRETNRVFEEFLNKYYEDKDFEQIPWYDLFFWEFRVSSWNGLVITGEQQLSYDITIPYNNRELLRLLLSTPLEYRVKDKPHFDIIKRMSPTLYTCGISVTNVMHTKKRAFFEKMYLNISSKLPF